MEVGARSVGANYILNGLKGVGKTTMLHALGAIAACVSKRNFPIYWIFEKRLPSPPVSPYTMITAALSLYDLKFDDLLTVNFDELVLKLMPSGTDMSGTDKYEVSKCFLLLDEVTTLYIPPEYASSETTDMMRNTCAYVLGLFREIARKGDVIIMLAASKVNIKDYVFQPQNIELMIYPNLNCGLFTVSQIFPPRTVPLVQDYWCAQYGENITAAEAEKVLHYTGGIGRSIDSYKTERRIKINFHCGFLLNDPKLFNLSGLLLSSPVINLASLQWYNINMSLVNKWVESMILYCDGTSVEFLTRKIADEVRDFFVNEKLYRMIHVFNLTRKGLRGGTPGHSNEELLFSIVPALLKLKSSMPQKEISILQSGSASIIIDGAEFTGNVESLCNELLLWSIDGVEIGIDRIWLQLNGDILYVSGAQVKSGKETKHITSGVLTTQRKKKIRAMDDATIAGILVKAERGFEALVNHLSRVFQITVEVDKLVIFTNITARSGYEDFWESNKSEMKKEEFRTASGSHFTCELFDGMDWIKDNVSDDVATLLEMS